MMANGSVEEVFVLLAAAFAGVAAVQVALVVGDRRAILRTRRLVASSTTRTRVEIPPSPGPS